MLVESLGPTARVVNGMWRYISIHSLVWPATLCPLIPRLLLQLFFFFSLWLFSLPGKLGATGSFRLALETVSKVSP